MMTKRDFEALAAALGEERPLSSNRYLQWVADTEAIACVCAASNPRFDRDRFLRACEGL